ncbi:winged helix-turn-helix domain-containing protein [uncultured Bacteroides sp.]|uniref:winged helix-turn-helix domain-containing protein n=1 Tax=uncultured Bacteroides sp. TaxID=162156 RepID=UPI0025E62FB1|nr:winged helix-turn-helix domain-containing protein [uncultured Bacteroides sp.]
MRLFTKQSEINDLIRKHRVHLSLILLFAVIIYCFLGHLYYNVREKDFNEKIKNVFIADLLSKLQKDPIESYIYSSEREFNEDEYSDTISVTDVDGVHKYPHDREKSRKNIAKDPKLRTLHSVYLCQHPLEADSLYWTWIKSLKQKRLNGTYAIELLKSDKNGNIMCDLTTENSSLINYKPCFDVTLGFRSEVEVRGYYNLPWFKLIGIRGFIYTFIYWILIISIFIVALHRRRKVVATPYMFRYLPQETILHNMGKEIIGPSSNLCLQEMMLQLSKRKYDMTPLAQNPTGVYDLGKNAKFNTVLRKIIIDKKEISLSPQASILLKHFLDAPNYILSNEEIKDIFWVDKSYKKEARLHNAVNRLRSYLENVPEIKIQKTRTKSYELVIIEPD